MYSECDINCIYSHTVNNFLYCTVKRVSVMTCRYICRHKRKTMFCVLLFFIVFLYPTLDIYCSWACFLLASLISLPSDCCIKMKLKAFDLILIKFWKLVAVKWFVRKYFHASGLNGSGVVICLGPVLLCICLQL